MACEASFVVLATICLQLASVRLDELDSSVCLKNKGWRISAVAAALCVFMSVRATACLRSGQSNYALFPSRSVLEHVLRRVSS